MRAKVPDGGDLYASPVSRVAWKPEEHSVVKDAMDRASEFCMRVREREAPDGPAVPRSRLFRLRSKRDEKPSPISVISSKYMGRSILCTRILGLCRLMRLSAIKS